MISDDLDYFRDQPTAPEEPGPYAVSSKASVKAIWCVFYPNYDHIPPLHRSRPTWGHLWLSRAPQRVSSRILTIFFKRPTSKSARSRAIPPKRQGLTGHYTFYHSYCPKQQSYIHKPNRSRPYHCARCARRPQPRPHVHPIARGRGRANSRVLRCQREREAAACTAEDGAAVGGEGGSVRVRVRANVRVKVRPGARVGVGLRVRVMVRVRERERVREAGGGGSGGGSAPIVVGR